LAQVSRQQVWPVWSIMARKLMNVGTAARRAMREVFARLDYARLGPIYCDEGGDEFWAAKRGLCQRLGLKLAKALLPRLQPGGTSLYVGAGVAEIPLLLMESLDLGRHVLACNLRRQEVLVLNRACAGFPIRFHHLDAGSVKDRVDHLWAGQRPERSRTVPRVIGAVLRSRESGDVRCAKISASAAHGCHIGRSVLESIDNSGIGDDDGGGGRMGCRVVPSAAYPLPDRPAHVCLTDGG
jgi:hypothetical protein